MMLLFDDNGVLRRPFGPLAAAAGFAFAALLGVLAR
jgi:hypothetical protein